MYFCEICQKGIKYNTNFIRHKKSKRHLRLAKEQSTPEPVIQAQQQTEPNSDKDKIIQELQETIKSQAQQQKEMMEIMKELVKKDSATTNNNNTTNNTQINNDNRSININIVGGENFKGIMNDDISTKMIDFADIEQLILDTYLKQVYIEREENRNIEYNDPSRKNCKVYTGEGQWERDNIDNVIERRIRASKKILPKMFKEMDDYKEQEEAYIKVCRNVKDFVNNEQGTKGYNSVVRNHRHDLSNIGVASETTQKYCEECCKNLSNNRWVRHLKTKTHLNRVKRNAKKLDVMEL